MQDNEYHKNDIFVGSNVLSLIYSIIDLKTTRNLVVSLIDKDDEDFSPLWLEKMNFLDFSFLKQLGRKYSISALENLDSFISPTNERFSLCGHDIYLTQNPYTNFLSLLRNINDLMDFSLIRELTDMSEKDFNNSIFSYAQHIAVEVLTNGAHSFDCKYKINKFFDLFAFEFFKHDNTQIKEFYKILQVAYTNHFSSKIADDELKYLLTSFLLPTFRVNIRALQSTLSAQLLTYSAQKFKCTTLDKNWANFENFMDHNLDLGKVFDFTYSNLLQPKEHSIFLSLDFSIDISDIDIDANELFTYADTEYSSDENPYIFFDVSPDLIKGHILYQEYKASRPEFYFESVKKIIDFVLKTHYPRLASLELFTRMNLTAGNKKWLCNKDHYPENTNSNYRGDHYRLDMAKVSRSSTNLSINEPKSLRMGAIGYFLLD